MPPIRAPKPYIKSQKKTDSPLPLVRDDIKKIDRQILKLLAKRYSLLAKIRDKGKIPVEDEKILREEWQRLAARISPDPDISSNLFSLIQRARFYPESHVSSSETDTEKEKRKIAFSLSPPHLPVKIQMAAPLDTRLATSWLFLAAASGSATSIANLPQNLPIFSFLKILVQLGAKLNQGDDNAAILAGKPVSRPDTVIHVDNSEFNFYLMLAWYLGGPSRAKFTSGGNEYFQDTRSLARYLSTLGCRFTSIIPKGGGLPARIECSGLMPDISLFPSELPPAFGIALCLASPFFEKPFTLDLSSHYHKEEIINCAENIFKQTEANYQRNGYRLSINPGSLTIPPKPAIGMDPLLSSFLLSFAEPLRGEVCLNGIWPDLTDFNNLWLLLNENGFVWEKDSKGIQNKNKAILSKFQLSQTELDKFAPVPAQGIPLLCSLAACAVLAGGSASIPPSFIQLEHVKDFYGAAGLQISPDGTVFADDRITSPIWNAPDAIWAIALSLAACAHGKRAGLQLGNPGVVAEIWSGFWKFYNGLPEPTAKAAKIPGQTQKRRRILTSTISRPPQIREEDWN